MKRNGFDCGTPIYLQIIESIRRRIVAGEWLPGGRVPPVRELASDFGVNPNTMQRALAELERSGLLFSERTVGRFITADESLISAERRRISREKAELFRQEMHDIGYSNAQILEALNEIIQKERVDEE